MYTLTLADGTKLEILDINGSNYISAERVDESIFTDNLSTLVELNNETGEEIVYRNVEFIQQQYWNADSIYPAGWYLAFRELSPQELLNAELKAENEMLTACLLEIGDTVYA